MSDGLRVILEIGRQPRRIVTGAMGWPGLDRWGKPARTWPIQFLLRRTAQHVMDHAWEMEDRDLTPR